MTLTIYESQIFKANAFALIDKIKVLGDQCYQLGRIGQVIMETEEEQNDILLGFGVGSFVTILEKVIKMRNSLTKFDEIVKTSMKMIRNYDEIVTNYCDLQEQQRKICSKVSVNKQIFFKCKTELSKLQRFFINYQNLLPILIKLATQ